MNLIGGQDGLLRATIKQPKRAHIKYAEDYPRISTALGAAAVDFLKQAQNQDKPFCLSVSFKAPHSPVSPDPKFDDVYAGKTFTKPENFGLKGAEHLPEHLKEDNMLS